MKQILKKMLNVGMAILFSLVFTTVTSYATSAGKTIDYMATHGYALGVASNFNVFATDASTPATGNDYAYIQNVSLSNARLAAGSFLAESPNKTIGWNQPNENLDSHMLVVGNRSNSSQTDGIIMETDQTKGVFAAEDTNTKPLRNQNNELVQVDTLSDVKDFTDNGVASFSDAQKQINDVSQFYTSDARLNKAFANQFLKKVNLTDDQAADLKAGKEIVVHDSGSQQHQFLIVNVPGLTKDDIKADTDVLNIKLKYVTKLTSSKKPIVILNFPNLSGNMELHSGATYVDVTYGTVNDQKPIPSKANLLLNFPKLNALDLNDAFVGTVLAPKATIQVNQFNEKLNALIAQRIRITTDVKTNGADGVFNPPDFQNNGENQDVTATAQHIYADGSPTTSTSFDRDAQMPELYNFDDQIEYGIRWSNHPDEQLYRSNDGKTWQATGINSDSDGNGSYSSEKEKPAQNLKLTQSQTADQATLTAANTKKVYFALAASDPNKDADAIDWQSSILLNMKPFTLSVPQKIIFESANVNNGVVTPSVTPQVIVDNSLGADFRLTLGVDATSANNLPSSAAKNVFLGANQFTYKQNDLNSAFQTLIPSADNADLTTTTNYDLTGLELKVPAELKATPATIGLKWNVDWGTPT
ncbi:hypothetical protein OXT66_07630 [Lentilactobacillus senioris]|uniref:hypothetical protein n=1 Tax=Lentilactobacillus senioris TaxID=931534 RepID=UPI0022815EFE|nr:hypothetical protein [Lentilactobacillus senioris]MCY9807402.1 hypothetical protein [Lentilactobacillus senioris]